MKVISLIFLTLFLISCSGPQKKALDKNDGFDNKKASILTSIANNYAENGLLTKATEGYFEAIEANPRFAPARYFLGQALVMRGFKEKGMAQVKKSLQIQPSFTQARLFLARHHFSEKNYKKAYYHSKYASKDLIYPNPEEAWVLVAKSLSKLKLKPEAKKIAKQALATRPRNCMTRRDLAKVLVDLDQTNSALVAIEQANELCTEREQKQNLTYLRALALYKMNKLHASRSTLERIRSGKLNSDIEKLVPKLFSRIKAKENKKF